MYYYYKYSAKCGMPRHMRSTQTSTRILTKFLSPTTRFSFTSFSKIKSNIATYCLDFCRKTSINTVKCEAVAKKHWNYNLSTKNFLFLKLFSISRPVVLKNQLKWFRDVAVVFLSATWLAWKLISLQRPEVGRDLDLLKRTGL